MSAPMPMVLTIQSDKHHVLVVARVCVYLCLTGIGRLFLA